jgi:carotenoid cleavage dioxygenase-like enzyme
MIQPEACLEQAGNTKQDEHPYASVTRSLLSELTVIRYLTGNFAPVSRVHPLTPCSYEGTIPEELAGGQYVRNGGNSIFNQELGRDYHWFDGDGMLCGVLFKKKDTAAAGIEPQFVNQFILTDLYLSARTSPTLRSHIVPSIATLVNPAASILRICLVVLRTLFIVLLSHLPGSSHGIKRISVTNTGLFYHDGRALATCESGPPIRVQLPELDTVGWYNGRHAEGERDGGPDRRAFGASGLLGFMNEWTTGHPKIDPGTGELILYHCTFKAPYVHYTIVPSAIPSNHKSNPEKKCAMNRVPVPRVSGAKMMHDFGVSARNTVLMDLPLSLDPFNLLRGKPVVAYDPTTATRFGIFPRYDPSSIRWFESEPCCIFHTANTWDECDNKGETTAVNFLVCRLTSPAPLFVAGNVEMPRYKDLIQSDSETARPSFFGRYDQDEACVQTRSGVVEIREAPLGLSDDVFDQASSLESRRQQKHEAVQSYLVPEEEQCRLFYYEFDMRQGERNRIINQFALSSIPFEFPSVHPGKEMSAARYVYGCSTSTSSFNVALGKTVKIDTLVKVDALALIAQGKQDPFLAHNGCVDMRTIAEIIRDNSTASQDLIKCFKLPDRWYAQEPRFIPRTNSRSEDDGFLLVYAFDESQLDGNGLCKNDAVSELWVLDARTMNDIVCRVRLPQRVPYGFHGMFFTEQQIAQQTAVRTIRTIKPETTGVARRLHNLLLGFVA